MPTWILWLSPVPLSALGAVAWNAWTSRERGPGEAIDSVQQYARFREAMDTPVPRQRRADRTRSSR